VHTAHLGGQLEVVLGGVLVLGRAHKTNNTACKGAYRDVYRGVYTDAYTLSHGIYTGVYTVSTRVSTRRYHASVYTVFRYKTALVYLPTTGVQPDTKKIHFLRTWGSSHNSNSAYTGVCTGACMVVYWCLLVSTLIRM
jgi:hypothetical protein